LDVLVDQALEAGFKILMVRPEHVYQMMTLPLHHRDPFDRIITLRALPKSFPLPVKTVFSATTKSIWLGFAVITRL
jgi:PIN domain nuclease of toxin-antitoxin system